MNNSLQNWRFLFLFNINHVIFGTSCFRWCFISKNAHSKTNMDLSEHLSQKYTVHFRFVIFILDVRYALYIIMLFENFSAIGTVSNSNPLIQKIEEMLIKLLNRQHYKDLCKYFIFYYNIAHLLIRIS